MAREIWPNFFIVGAPKAGTTSLYEYLRRVPGVYMSPIKEPHFFNTINLVTVSSIPPIRGKAKYLRLFQGVRDEVAIGEASTAYLRDPETPERIREVVPGARIIMLLRDPVERAFSHYLAHIREGVQLFSFPEALRKDPYKDMYLAPGFYAQQVKRYLDAFGPGAVKILIFEEFIQDPKKAVNDVLRFLGLNSQPPLPVGEAHNAFAIPRVGWAYRLLRNRWARRAARALIPAPLRMLVRKKVLLKKASKPAMPQEARRFLEEVFRSDVQRLEHILGRSLSWFQARGQPAQDQDKRTAAGTGNAHR